MLRLLAFIIAAAWIVMTGIAMTNMTWPVSLLQNWVLGVIFVTIGLLLHYAFRRSP